LSTRTRPEVNKIKVYRLKREEYDSHDIVSN